MDLNETFFEQHVEDFIKSRQESARTYRQGTGSLTVAMIGRVAAGLRWLAGAVENWAAGPSEAAVQASRHVSIR